MTHAPPTATRSFLPFDLAPSSPAWAACERELADAGVPLPLALRTAADGRARVVGVRDTGGRCVAAAAVLAHPTRALPGHRILRVERFGAAGSAAARGALASALAEAARRDRRALRLHVEAFGRGETDLEAAGRDLRDAGFRPAAARGYERTVAIGLEPSEDELFASLHATARRHVRAVGKNPVELRDVHHPVHADRLDALLRETMQRTGGVFHPQDFAGTLELARRRPELVRVVGLFRREAAGPEALLAYAVGLAHGDHVQYATAASTRATDVKMPLGYAPAWELIRWAKQLGASWFDFGGITPGSHADAEDPRGGISDFKRYFSRAVVRVAQEWMLEPHPMRARVAGVVGWLGRRG